jgi:uncharacterized membrane protein YbjE (DUF340 family)
MTPIISPWIIYFLGIVPKMTAIFEIFSVMGVLATIIILFIAYSAFKDDMEVPLIFRRKTLVTSVFLFTVTVNFLNMFVPNQDTAIKMLVANEITYERLDMVKSETKDIYNVIKKDVFEIIQEINKKDE